MFWRLFYFNYSKNLKSKKFKILQFCHSIYNLVFPNIIQFDEHMLGTWPLYGQKVPIIRSWKSHIYICISSIWNNVLCLSWLGCFYCLHENERTTTPLQYSTGCINFTIWIIPKSSHWSKHFWKSLLTLVLHKLSPFLVLL